MKFMVKAVKLKEDKSVYVYIPKQIPQQLRFIDPIEYTKIIMGNAEGFTFLKELFTIIASDKEKNRLFYLPNRAPENERYRQWFKIGIFDLDLVAFNYHSIQLDNKDIAKTIEHLKHVKCEEEEIELAEAVYKCQPLFKTRGKLSTKVFGKYFIIAGNKEVYSQLAYDSNRFRDYEDKETYYCEAHVHEDAIGSSKDNGLDFWYYYEGLKND